MRPTITVTVRSVRVPTITWRCATCHRLETFECSERFRANANGKVVDIWLVYRCQRCETTKNITVVERTPVRRIAPALLRAAEDDDPATARRLARDVGLLRHSGATVAAGDAWVLARDVAIDDRAGAVLRLELPEPLLVRLDGVVAAAIGTSRQDVRGRLELPAGSPRPDTLRRWSTLDLILLPAG